MTEKIIEKIKKLMSLAGSSNEAEAQLASKKAQDLMMKHNIEAAQIKTSVNDYTHEQLAIKRVSREQSLVNVILKEFFFVTPLIDRRDGTIKYIGLPSNIEVALYVNDYLLQTFKNLWKEYKKEHRLASRLDYLHGLYDGLASKLRENKRSYETKVKEQTATDVTALVDASKAMMRSYIDEEFGKTSKRSVGGYSYNDAYYNGVATGRSINISRGVTERSSSAVMPIGYNK